jgi:MFS family permease
LRGYLAFLLRHRRFLGFGALVAASSSFGQTWFVSLFGADIRAAFDLGHAGFGAVYSIATLASGIALFWVGRLVDRFSLSRVVTAAYLALAAGCLAMVAASGVIALGFTLFVLRIAGQGMLTHASATAMARHFERGRGKALSIAALGFPLAETVLPAGAVAAAAWLGWQGAWIACAVLVACALLPLALVLARSAPVDEADEPRARGAPALRRRRDWTRREVVRDPRFALVLPALLAAPFISAGVMFHQVHLVEAKGWTLGWLAACYVGYAGAKIGGNLVCGPMVDRFTAVHLFPLFLPPLALALALLAAGDHRLVGLGFFALAGLTTGFGGPIGGAYWAERYGLAHLGAIRALAMSIMVLGSALSPVAYGWLLDAGIGFEAIASASAMYVVGAVALAGLACWTTAGTRA